MFMVRNTHTFNFVKFVICFVFLLFSLASFAQKYVSIGGDKGGIAFGNPEIYNGIRFNFIDKEQAEHQNGLIITVKSQIRTYNGLNFSLMSRNESISNLYQIEKKDYSNGIRAGLVNINGVLNGLQVGFYNTGISFKGNGVMLGIMNNHVQNRCLCYSTLNGFQAGIINTGYGIKGLRIGLLNIQGSTSFSLGILNIDNKAGLQIGIFNYVRYDKGIQLGLLNYRKENKKPFKLFPLVNF